MYGQIHDNDQRIKDLEKEKQQLRQQYLEADAIKEEKLRQMNELQLQLMTSQHKVSS